MKLIAAFRSFAIAPKKWQKMALTIFLLVVGREEETNFKSGILLELQM
jgi:hypothetical protein